MTFAMTTNDMLIQKDTGMFTLQACGVQSFSDCTMAELSFPYSIALTLLPPQNRSLTSRHCMPQCLLTYLGHISSSAGKQILLFACAWLVLSAHAELRAMCQ